MTAGPSMAQTAGGRPWTVSPNVVIGSLLGSTVEYYEFSVFAGASSLVFRSEFFPSFDPNAGILLAFGTSAIAYLARPLGAILFGHLGDRVGRKPTMLATFVIMGLATVLMGLLPTYAIVGYWASVMLVGLRIVQGLANGGEFGGAALMACESAPQNRRGLYASSALIGLSIGNLLGSAVFSIAALLPHDQFLAWGWRIPFLLSACLVLPGILVRRKLQETPAYVQQVSVSRPRAPILEVLREQPRRLALITGVRMGETILFNVVTLFALDYSVRSLKMSPSLYLTGLSIGAFVSLAVTPAFAALSDRVGRRAVALIGGVVTCLLGFVFLPLLSSGYGVLALLSVVGMMGGAAAINNATPAVWYPELFAARYRYTAISVGYQLGAVAGGVTPILAALLVASFGPAAVTILVVGAGGLILACALALPETCTPGDPHRL